MWEIEIICNRRNKSYISLLQEKLERTIKETNAVTAIVADSDRIYFSIGCDKKMKAKLVANLKLSLTDIICENMKFDFLSKNLDFFYEDDAYNYALIKVCTYFDNELDRQIVLNSLDFKSKKLDLNSFFYFKLRRLKDKWLELCSITNTNINVIKLKDNFVGLLRFLISNIDSRCQSAILELRERCLIYHDIKEDCDVVMGIEVKDKIGILDKLLELNPNLIKIYANNENDDVIHLLKNIFDDKVIFG